MLAPTAQDIELKPGLSRIHRQPQTVGAGLLKDGLWDGHRIKADVAVDAEVSGEPNDIGHAWQVIEAVRKWPEERQLRFLSALTMQNEGSAHPLAWLAFSARFPAVALCRAALIASMGCNAPVSANVE